MIRGLFAKKCTLYLAAVSLFFVTGGCGAGSGAGIGNSSAVSASSVTAGSQQAAQTNIAASDSADLKKYLNNPDDDKYFKPATDDYIALIDANPDVIRITLVSFDSDRKVVQNIRREQYTDPQGSYESFQPNEGQKVSGDKKVMYDDMTSQLDQSGFRDDKRTTYEKYRVIYEYSREAKDNANLTLYVSKGLTPEDTKKEKSDDSNPVIQQLKSLASKAGDDYRISVVGEKVSKDAGYTPYRGKQILVFNAFSYYKAQIENYDEAGNIVKHYNVYVFDSPSMINDFVIFGQARITEDGKAVVDEATYSKVKESTNCKSEGNLYYMDYNDRMLSDELANVKKYDDLYDEFNYDPVYYSKPRLSETQIQNMLK